MEILDFRFTILDWVAPKKVSQGTVICPLTQRPQKRIRQGNKITSFVNLGALVAIYFIVDFRLKRQKLH
jgi:hypothetical protein